MKTMKIFMEIQAGEGGKDARTLVTEQFKIYFNYATANNLKCNIVKEQAS